MTTSPKKRGKFFDPRAFGKNIRVAIKNEGLSLRAAGEEAGVNYNTLHRITYGRSPSVENYLRLMTWLENLLAKDKSA